MRIFIFFLSLFAILLNSCSTVKKNDSLDFTIFFLKDIKDKESINTISTKEMRILESPNIGFENGTYWFKVDLKNKNLNKPLVFDVAESNIYDIDLYQNGEKINYKKINNTHFSLLVNKYSSSDAFFFKVVFKNEVYFPLKISLYDDTALEMKFSFFKNGMYYGVALVVLILNTFFYFSLKDKIFLYYCLFLISITLGILSYDGLLQLFISKSLSTNSSVITHFLITFFGFLFGYKFLNIPYYLPKSKYIGFILLALASLFYILFFITKQYLFTAIADTISFFVLLYNWATGILIFKKHEFAKFLVIGYSLILFSTALFILPTAWGLDIYTTSLSTIKFGSFFEMLILTYAITYRVKILQVENKKMKNEIKKYLNRIRNEEVSNYTEKKIREVIKNNNLSEREGDVLLLIFKEYTNPRIGEELHISLNTVKYHIRNIYEKLNINSKKDVINLISDN